MRVADLIQTAFSDADEKASKSAHSTQELHRGRAIAWVNALAQQFVPLYPRHDGFRVFSKYDESNRADFGLNELLFDVAVCEVAQAPSVRSQHALVYVKRAVWQIESEFAKNSREAVWDFNKLVLGSAPNKLFVAPVTAKPGAFRDALLPVAGCCSGRVFLAVVPHPEDWDKGRAPEIFVLAEDGWVVCVDEAVRHGG
jgi:hypothetical protein